jgi:hypothetical protein
MRFSCLQKNRRYGIPAALLCVLLCPACSRPIGWGMLLWSSGDPAIPSGTVLPVYIRSNIEQVWVVGVPEAYRNGPDGMDKAEIPLPRFELAGNRRAAEKRAAEFAPLALTYAETLQDGLPIRETPDNGARRVYRLRAGETVKILAEAEGAAAISAGGDPLPGSWYRVMAEDGTTGYCFSYRLKLFEHYGGPLKAAPAAEEDAGDPDLDMLLSKIWSPESYGVMVNNRRIDLEELSKKWRFDPGQETGTARIYLPDLDVSFTYTRIQPTGARSWHFTGTSLQMSLRRDTVLSVQFTDPGGALRSLLFTALPVDIDDLITQETDRREALFGSILSGGPSYTSSNYGTLVFSADGRFNWTGNILLIPRIIPASALGSGSAAMDLFLHRDLESRYDGAFTLRFDGVNGGRIPVRFMYALDTQGFRLEYAPDTSMDGTTVVRRASSPMVLYFFRTGDSFQSGVR